MLGSADATCVGENDSESQRVRKDVTATTCSSLRIDFQERRCICTCIKINTRVVRPKKDSVDIASWDGHGGGRGAGSAGGTNRRNYIHNLRMVATVAPPPSAAADMPGSESFESCNFELPTGTDNKAPKPRCSNDDAFLS